MKSKVSYICKKKEKCLFKKIMEKHSLKTNKLDLQHKKQKHVSENCWRKKKPTDDFLVEIGFLTSYKSQDWARCFFKEKKLSLDFRVN